MRAVIVTQPDKLEVVQIEKPRVGPYQALVRTELAALCNSTDSKLVSGHFPGVQKFPMVLGHEDAGIVEEIGTKVRNFKPGDRAIGGLVFDFAEPGLHGGFGGFCDYTVVNDHDAMVADGVADAAHGWRECHEIQRKVDADIPLEEAVILCMWREVYGGFGDFRLQAGDCVLVFGAGPVGLSFVKFGRLLGLKWIGVVDPLPRKRDVAQRMGADAVYAPAEVPGLQQKMARSLDAIIDAVGNEKIVNLALPMVKMGGSICVYGVIAASAMNVEKELGPYNFNLYFHQWPTRWREREAQAPLCDWIRQGKLKASEFVTHQFPIERIADAFAAVRTGQVVKCLLRY
ncbi:MAG: zinc-binding dehydrogenase [Opitutaceae bacterium]|nr:zinc-binding dehydrogenase [Opitutaceae bacterium]